jgi:Mrp family chromosome partitioning ATPase
LLTAGPTPDNALELLLNKRFAVLIEEWRQSFDFVVLDTAPTTEYSDGLAVASLIKRALVLSRARHTPYKESRDLLRRLAAIRSQIVGAVINHF